MSTIAQQLIHNGYWVHVAERVFHPKEIIEEFGIMGVTSEEDAHDLLSSTRLIRTTIPDIANYHESGTYMEFHDVEDAARIYAIINEHLTNWLQVCNQTSYIDNMPPFDEFEALDNLCRTLFPYRGLTGSGLNSLRFNSASILNPSQGFYANISGAYDPFAPKIYPYCKMYNISEA